MPLKLLLNSAIVLCIFLFAPAHAKNLDETNITDAAGYSPEETIASTDKIGKNATGIILIYSEEEDLWERIRTGYDIEDLHSPLTARHENWYASRPDYIARMVARSERYLHYIVEEVEKRNMPSEIALLPMIESAFNPQAMSSSRAAGIWQFMPLTGKHYGLQQDWWVDHRKNVTAATNAALDYLEKLYAMFGSWDLALAAYNAGEGTVSRAIEKNRKQGLPTDYPNLPLPDETRNYVPKLLAIKNIVTYPERYGLNIESIPNQPYFAKVTAPEQIDAELAAELAGISFDEFAALNPEHNRPVLTAKGDSVHEILLPVGAAEIFETNLAEYDQPLVSWKTYHAKRGERLDVIARKFGITTTELRKINSLPPVKMLKDSRAVLVPDVSGTTTPTIDQKKFEIITVSHHRPELHAKQAIRHTVTANETLFAIALRYGVTVKDIKAINKLKSSMLKIGQVLLIKGSGKKAIQKQAGKPREATSV
jgi:membrane-bound lytic murein transglycosylase D